MDKNTLKKEGNELPFTLDIFEGPLPFLLHLIQKSEIHIHDVPIQEITSQFLKRLIDQEKQMKTSPLVDSGAEFIGIASLLVWMKSKRLLPKHGEEKQEEEDLDPQFEILYKILEYCEFKEVAKDFGLREEEQAHYFTRGIHALPEPPKKLGIEHLTIEDLATLFKKTMERAENSTECILEEPWKVSDKIEMIQHILNETNKRPFSFLFSNCHSKGETIVTFLALLELMKSGSCFVGKENKAIFIYAGSYEEIKNGKS